MLTNERFWLSGVSSPALRAAAAVLDISFGAVAWREERGGGGGEGGGGKVTSVTIYTRVEFRVEVEVRLG